MPTETMLGTSTPL